ncbi:C40 family peptidase [Nanchangia anserum]|uniref:C40 family peptidase n=1 Tax=Nanchangia anserum TaxID=2692125 RepID=A0A8I0GAF7_9ACTO|nr:NlpC/P60 family protein [Nanchangia anserum]MBD3690119.1 C40 family peptidase [Nanchangia anserum]QOX82096.1 C40 family peptidase [Nanchangia anserum]
MSLRMSRGVLSAVAALSLVATVGPLAHAEDATTQPPSAPTTQPAPEPTTSPGSAVPAESATPSETAPAEETGETAAPSEPSEAPASADASAPVSVPFTEGLALSVVPRSGPFSTAKHPTLSFGARTKVGWAWPQTGVMMPGDFTGDRRSDILLFFVEDGSVKIRLYQGTGSGGVTTVGVIGQGWNEFDYVSAADVTGDGRADLIGRKKNGELWLYPSGGMRFVDGQRIGWGWQGMRSLTAVPAPSWGMPSVMATDQAGRLYRYPFTNRSGRFGDPITYGLGWTNVSRIMPAGDVDANGQPDFYTTDSAGDFYLYQASNNGRAYTSYRMGNGWSIMPQIMAVPNTLGAGVYGIDTAGDLYWYPINTRAVAKPSPWLTPVTSIRKPGWTVTPQLGWNGTKVRVVRLALGQGAPLDASMTFTSSTRSAVVRFQQRAGLGGSGVVDRTTWGRMTGRDWWMDNWQAQPRVGVNASRAERVEAMIAFANLAKGAPYTWGGAGPWNDGFDCSGLALQAIYSAGYDPQPINVVSHAGPTYRTSKELYAHPKLERVPFSQRQRGDLVFWQGSGGIYHVAIYLGNNQIIEANYGYVRQRALYNWGQIAPYVKRVAH